MIFDPMLYSQFQYNVSGQRGAFYGYSAEPWVYSVGMNVINYPPTIPQRSDVTKYRSSTALPVGAGTLIYTVPKGKVMYLTSGFMHSGALCDCFLVVGSGVGDYGARLFGLTSVAGVGPSAMSWTPAIPIRLDYGDVLWVSNHASANGTVVVHGWIENSSTVS